MVFQLVNSWTLKTLSLNILKHTFWLMALVAHNASIVLHFTKILKTLQYCSSISNEWNTFHKLIYSYNFYAIACESKFTFTILHNRKYSNTQSMNNINIFIVYLYHKLYSYVDCFTTLEQHEGL